MVVYRAFLLRDTLRKMHFSWDQVLCGPVWSCVVLCALAYTIAY